MDVCKQKIDIKVKLMSGIMVRTQDDLLYRLSTSYVGFLSPLRRVYLSESIRVIYPSDRQSAFPVFTTEKMNRKELRNFAIWFIWRKEILRRTISVMLS